MKVIRKSQVKLKVKSLKNEFHYSYKNIFGNYSGLAVLIPI